MKRFRQIGIRHLFIAILVTAIGTSFIVLQIQRKKLEAQQQTNTSYARETDFKNWKFFALKRLSVESQSQREAIAALLENWDSLEYRGGCWPEIDDKKFNTFLFSDGRPTEGATLSVLVVLSHDDEKALDALVFRSNGKTERHASVENVNDAGVYVFEIETHSTDNTTVTNQLEWTISSSGMVLSE